MKYKEAFDRIRNDDKSKIKLREAVLNELEKKNKRLRIKIFCRFAIFFLIFTGVSAVAGLYYFMPVNDISIDINSIGVQIRLSNAGYVVSCYYGEGIPDGFDVKGMDLSRALSKIVDAATEGEPFYSALAVVSVRTDRMNGTEALKSKVEKEILGNASVQNITMKVYYAGTNVEMISSAKNENVTSGKYYLIKLVQAMNPEIQTIALSGYKPDNLINMFMEAYRVYLDLMEIKDVPTPLAPFPDGSSVSEPPAETDDIESAESSLNLLSANEVAKQYAILSGLIQ